MSIQHKFVSSITLAWLCGLFAGCEIHDYSVDSCVSLSALESKYGDLIEQTFLERHEIEPSEYPEITYYTYQRATLTEEDEARARRGDRLPNNALPEHLDYFMAARSHTMMVYEYYTLPRGSDSGFFKGGKPGDCLLYTSPSPRDLSTSRMPSSA